MGDDEKRTGTDRRATNERRSGTDTRSEEEKRFIGERRPHCEPMRRQGAAEYRARRRLTCDGAPAEARPQSLDSSTAMPLAATLLSDFIESGAARLYKC